MFRMLVALLLGGASLTFAALAGADLRLERAEIAAGGGKAEGGPFTLHIVSGQPVTGLMSQGNLALQAGILPPADGPKTDHLFSNGFEGN